MPQPEFSGQRPREANSTGSALLAPQALVEPWGAEELAAALNTVGTAVWALDLEGRCVFINQAACRILGYTREECLGRTLQCGIHRGHPDGWNCQNQDCPVQNALESGAAERVEDDVFLRRDGTLLAVQYSVQPVVVQGRRRGAVVSFVEISAQKRAEEALRTSNEWLDFVQKAARVGIFDLDFKTGQARVSEGQFHVFGLDPAGKWPSHEEWRKLVHLEDRERIDRELKLELAGVQPPGGEYRVVWPDGSIHWLFSRTVAVFDEAGKATHLVGTNVDITDRVRAETALNQFFTAAPTPLSIWDLDGRIQRTNPAWEPMLGFTAAEMAGLPLLDFVHPEDRAAAATGFENLLKSGNDAGFECRTRCKDGSWRWLLLSACILKDEQLIYATAHDITERKKAEQALRDSEARFRSAFENTLFGMAVTALDGRFLEVNQSFCRMTGFTEQELLQKDFEAITLPEDVPQSLECRRALVEGAPADSNIPKRYVRKDGELVWVHVHVALVHDTQGKPSHFIAVIEDISGRKRVEEALHKNEEWLSFTLDTAGIGLCYRESGRTRASEQQFHLYGLKWAEEWISRDRWLQLIHPDDRERVEAQERFAVEHARPYDTQFRVLWPDGSVHWLLCRGKRLHVDGGSQKAEITVDVTERKRAEAALGEFINMSRSPIVVFGFDGLLRRVNAALLQTSGYTAEEFAARPVIEFFHPDDRPAMQAEFERLIAQGGNAEFECRGICKDGSIVWLIFAATAVPDEKSIFTVAYDITERKLAETALAEEALRRHTVFEQSRDGIVIFDRDGKVCQSNRSFADMLGYSPEEMLQLHVWDWEAQRTRDQTLKMMQDAKSLPPTFETRHKRKDGSLFDAEISTIAVEFGGDVFHYSVIRDISARKRMAEALERHTKKLAQSNEELERFAFVASHDLQEPLRMVASFTQLLANRYSGKLDETADRYINFAVDGAKRMQQLISDLLAYSRANSKDLELQPTDCEAVVRATLQNLRAAVTEGGAVVEWDPLPVLMADPVQLGQLFQNLIGNATKFRGQAPLRIHIAAADNGAEWLFSIQDNGIGIDPRHADRIFQIFQRLHTRTEYPGTGIGLAICQKVVERHGGRIWVESQLGKGANFRFTLPKRETEGAVNAGNG